MIKVNEEEVKIEGSKTMVLSELAMLISKLDEMGFSEESIRMNVDLGFLNEEELHDALIDSLKKFFLDLSKEAGMELKESKKKTRKNKKTK